MIAKITKGKKARPALAYDFGPGRRDEHENARIIAGSVPGTWRQVGRLMDAHAQQRDLKQPVWRCSLSLPDEDGKLTDRRFRAIAKEYIARMGFGGCPWVAVRHGDDHIHLTVIRVGWDGRTVDAHGDFIKSMPIVRALEAKHGLVNAAERSDRQAPQVSGQERAAAERRGAVEPERLRIRRLAREARQAAAGLGQEAFEAALAARGVEYRLSASPTTGRVFGYSFSVPDWIDADGAQIWVTASKTAKDLSWQKLAPVIERQAGPSTAPPADRQGRAPRDGDQVEEADKPKPPDARTPLESMPPPVDPAKQLLAAVRAAAEKAEEEAQAETFSWLPDPALHMDRRLHGKLTEAALTQARAAAASKLGKLQGELDVASAAAMRLDGIASGVTAGAQLTALTEQRGRLETAVAHLSDATAATTAADGHAAQAAAARAVEAEATKKARRGRLVLAAMFTTPAAEREMAKAAGTLAGQHEREVNRLLREAATATTKARKAAPGIEEPAVELRRMVEGWPKLEKAARQADIGTAKVMKAEQTTVMRLARTAVTEARQALGAVDSEIALRATLPPALTTAENQARAELEQLRRVEAAKGRSTTTPRRSPSKRPPTPQPPRPPRGYDPRDRGPGNVPGL